MLKVLFSSSPDGNLSQYNVGLLSALNQSGNKGAIWNQANKPILDAFFEFGPDVLFLDSITYLSRAVVKAITKYNKKIAIVLEPYNSSEYDKFVPLLNELKDHLIPVVKAEKLDDFSRWGKIVDEAAQIAYGLDTINYGPGSIKDNLVCDITYVGGYDDNKKDILSKHVLPLTYGNYNIKIFGNQRWPSHKYIGFISAEEVRNLYASATVTLYLPTDNHTIHEKFYQIVGCGGIPVIPYPLESSLTLMDICSVYDNNLGILIDDYKKHPKNRVEEVKYNLEFIKQHTYQERIKVLLNSIG